MPQQTDLEAAFGVDLSHLLSFEGADAALDALGAEAATDGEVLLFRQGPDRETLAHEVSHALQDGGGKGLSKPGQASEREAADTARCVAAGEQAGPQEATREAGVSLEEDDGTTGSKSTSMPEGGTAVNQIGVVAWDGKPWLRVRSSPTTREKNTLVHVAFGARLQVMKRFPGDWLYVATEQGGITGYVSADHVWMAPDHPLPEPRATLHRVEGGPKGYAINIAQDYYGDRTDDWGQDARFYVAVLGKLNGLDVPDSVSGWKTVAFDARDIIWIPSPEFALGMKGSVNSGSWTYETADAVGLAEGIERAGQLTEDFQTAVSLSGQYLWPAVKRHATESFWAVLESLLLLALGAIGVIAVSTVIGAAIGALAGGAGAAPGAAAGFKVGLAIVEWVGLGFLIAWIASSMMRIGSAFATFMGTVWEANGDRSVLDQAAKEHAEAWGTVVGVAIEALVMFAAAKGVGALLGFIRGTRFGETVGESRMGRWVRDRLGEVKEGDTPVPGPRETVLRGRARTLAKELGIAEEAALRLLRRYKPEQVKDLHRELGKEPLEHLSTKEPAFLEPFEGAWEAAKGDALARAELAETVRLNQKGTTSNKAAIETFNAYTRFKAEYGDLISGDFVSRFRRLFSADKAQAEAELALARDLLDGKSPLGETTHVEGLAESTVPGEKTPEYRVRTPAQTVLAEVKAVGDSKTPLSKNNVHRNAGTANQQLRSQSSRTGEADGLIRLDARKAKPSEVTPELLAEWVSGKLPSPRDSVATRWVEILYVDSAGNRVKVTLERVGRIFEVSEVGTW